MTFRHLVAASAVSAALLAAPAMAQTRTPVHTDHHVHVHSPAILEILPAYCSSPGRIGPCDPAFVEPLTADDLLADMDEAGVQTAWMMSTAYLAESPMMVPPLPDAATRVHDANAFTVATAAAHPGRLVAFVSVNPLTSDALAEIQAWKGEPYAKGLKLHLTNSGVDLRHPDHVRRLAAVFDAASDAGLTIMIHMRTRAEDYGARDVRIFVEQVLPHARSVPVVIAHSGGWGGLDANTWDAMEAFRQILDEQPTQFPNLYFDLAQVFDAETSQDDRARLVQIMRGIGVERFAPGSDWPFSGPLDGYLNAAMALLPLSLQEAESLRRRRIGTR
ncbi:putative TIM-barrel fold metal-dependent hydrolase [Brevundimonas vesicularis]|uniref:amidohydrolase family protein n=1 Tax=Brevundimonas vesicularis TaxID=41276 RepID=UPI00277DD2A4|nr:amidohydrolase family protein [Brevundimonas vesicularis]MDQ1193807.1 putative TIM-barrel fold metal-dependent hydrolase [Brevundimonas vesicularis]